MFLAFLKKFRFDHEEKREENFVILKIDTIMINSEFSFMLNDFIQANNIPDGKKFLLECFTLIEEFTLGRLIDENTIEIKLDDKISQEILNLLMNNQNGMNYLDIVQNLTKLYDNFFMGNYIKFIIEDLIQQLKIHQIDNNVYQILELI